MADERLKRMAWSWGLVGLGMQACFVFYVFVKQAWADYDDFVEHEKLDAIRLRFGQLKPPMFKFPSADWLIWLYVLAVVLCLIVVWRAGLRSLLRDR